MDADERYAANRKLHEAVRQIRGRLLNHVAVIDVEIGLILASYFCSSEAKRDRLMSDVFSDPSYGLRRKSALLKRIVESNFADILRDYEEQFSKFGKLRKFRNVLAHSMIDVSEGAHRSSEHQVGFVTFRNAERQVRVVTFREAEDYEVIANDFSGWLRGIASLLGVRLGS